MKTLIRVLMTALLFSLGHGVSRADAGYSFDFSLAQKKEGGTEKQTSALTIKNQKWSYTVTMSNKSFKDVEDMEIKYVVFSRQDEAGEVVKIGHLDLNRHDGSTSIKELKNNDSVTFSTDAIALKTTQLSGGYYWENGAGSTAKGALRGIWIRVYIGSAMVAEYMDPPNLSDKQTFDPPPKDNN